MQGKGSNPLKVLIKENEVIYQSINQLNPDWCHTVIKFHSYIYVLVDYIQCIKCSIFNITVEFQDIKSHQS